ncbi:MAG: hypothetical protein SGBAC_007619 [Bacillariaceae sp.]
MKDPCSESKSVTRAPNARMQTTEQTEDQKQKSIWENSLFDEISEQSRDGSSLVSQDQNADSLRIFMSDSTSPKDEKITPNMQKAHPVVFELTQDVPMLDRNQSQITSASQPGAVHVPGLARRSPSSHRGTNGANEDAAIFQADLVSEQQQEESHDAEASTSCASVPVLPVVAEVMKDGVMKTSVSFTLLDRRLLSILSILLIVIVGFAFGITIVLMKKDDTKAASTELSPSNLNPTASPLAFTSPPPQRSTNSLSTFCHHLQPSVYKS